MNAKLTQYEGVFIADQDSLLIESTAYFSHSKTDAESKAKILKVANAVIENNTGFSHEFTLYSAWSLNVIGAIGEALHTDLNLKECKLIQRICQKTISKKKYYNKK